MNQAMHDYQQDQAREGAPDPDETRQRQVQETADANAGKIGWRCVSPNGRVFGGTVTRAASIRRGRASGGMPPSVEFDLSVMDERRPAGEGLEHPSGWRIEPLEDAR